MCEQDHAGSAQIGQLGEAKTLLIGESASNRPHIGAGGSAGLVADVAAVQATGR
jgi:hypothetical protein